MIRIFWLIILPTTFLFTLSLASAPCTVLSSAYFRWLNDDGSLVLNATSGGAAYQNEVNDNCCGRHCNEKWKSLKNSPNCQFCFSRNALVCHGSDVYSPPNPSTLPSQQLSLFRMSGVGLISLPPKSFSGLTIHRLVIQDSNLTYVASDTFAGVRSITLLYLRNNTLEHLYPAGRVFNHLSNLRVLDLGNNGLRILSSRESANLKKLEYLSLAGNPIYMFDVYFLQNSNISFLDLRNVVFNVKPSDMEDEGFALLPTSLRTIDFSGADIPAKVIEKMLYFLREKNITTLNLGFLKQSAGLLVGLLPVRNTLTYISFQGTDMNDVFPLKPIEKRIFETTKFLKVRELNMKGCKIKNLGGGEVFAAFPNLASLSLSDNEFSLFDLKLVTNLRSLNYLELRENIFNDIAIPPLVDNTTFKNVQALDLSLSEINLKESVKFVSAFQSVVNLSLCGANINEKLILSIQNMTLRFLDLSDTNPNSDMMLAYSNLFVTQASSLLELRFARNEFVMSAYPLLFSALTSLQVLDLSNNMIRELSKINFGLNLRLLFLSHNLVTSWYFSALNSESNLKYLDLSSNQISFISDAMLEDFYKLEFLDLDNNPLICHKKVVAMVCADMMNRTSNLTMLGWQQYNCYDTINKSIRLFAQPQDCDDYYEEVSTIYDNGGGITYPPKSMSPNNFRNEMWLFLLISSVMLVSAVGSIVYVKWWNIRCYVHRYLSLRKVRMLRKDHHPLTRREIHYDVFVSYSDVDRSWVLDQLIPNIEGDSDISLCFHERDFQVGLGILENIIECMDRSHSLLLIVSSGFIHSKWCQFEMHLAQFRLIETIRDQLVLVLLEDIPRKSRPETLHHLMMTKTYLLWPQQPGREDSTELFWRRLKRALKPNQFFSV